MEIMLHRMRISTSGVGVVVVYRSTCVVNRFRLVLQSLSRIEYGMRPIIRVSRVVQDST